jgi:hypothetical protein
LRKVNGSNGVTRLRERTVSGSNGPVEPDLDLDEEELFMIGRLVSADVIEHETDHAPDYGDYGVISGRLALSWYVSLVSCLVSCVVLSRLVPLIG